MILIMKKLRLPDLSKLSAVEKDRLIRRLHAIVRAEEAKLDAEEAARLRADRPRFLAGEASKTQPAKLGDDGK
jgi:hypothetical protein